MTEQTEVAVIGGGIAGLAAALDLSALSGVAVTLFEAAEQLGGKLRAGEIAGVTVDVGAESVLAARPEALSMAGRVGLKPSVEFPAARHANVLSRGSLRPLPPGLVTGVPTDLRALAASRIMTLPGLLRIPWDQVRRGVDLDGDVSVGDLLRDRLGQEVVDRLAEPLLAGVYAGDPFQLSLQMANPSLFRQLTRDDSLLDAAQATRAGSGSLSGSRRGPVFAGFRGGIARLAQKTAEVIAAQGGLIRTGVDVQRLRRTGGRWQVMTAEQAYDFDAVVVAVPAPPAARMLRISAPFVAAQLLSMEYASVAVVSLAYRASEVESLDGSGFLVPPIEGHQVKGVTFTSAKWSWAARAARSAQPRGNVLVRASFGRHGDEAVLERDDEELVALALAELHDIAGLPAHTVDATVTRWDEALPQYRVGHAELVQRARTALTDVPGLALAGAAYDGVGVASCIASGQSAARAVRRHVEEMEAAAHG